MKYLLDTNSISYWMRGDHPITTVIKSKKPADLAICTTSLAEILFGIQKSPSRKKERHIKISRILEEIELLTFSREASGKYAVIRCQLERQGTPISERDTQIAAVALANALTVITHNTGEFRRVEGLCVEDWYKGKMPE